MGTLDVEFFGEPSISLSEYTMYTRTLRLHVASAHDLHLLEKHGTTLAKHVVALRELLLDTDRAYLPAGERNVRDLFRDADPPLESSAFRNGEMTSHAINDRIIHRVGCELVIGGEPLEHCVTLKDKIGFVGSTNGGRHARRTANMTAAYVRRVELLSILGYSANEISAGLLSRFQFDPDCSRARTPVS